MNVWPSATVGRRASCVLPRPSCVWILWVDTVIGWRFRRAAAAKTAPDCASDREPVWPGVATIAALPLFRSLSAVATWTRRAVRWRWLPMRWEPRPTVRAVGMPVAATKTAAEEAAKSSPRTRTAAPVARPAEWEVAAAEEAARRLIPSPTAARAATCVPAKDCRTMRSSAMPPPCPRAAG